MHHSGFTRREFLAQSSAALAVSSLRSLQAAVPSPRSGLQPLTFRDVRAGGDLAHRTQQNFTRLQADIYRPPAVFRQVNWRSWPGDFEGRALLADILLAQSTGQSLDYLPAMLAAYPPQLNSEGYFGPLLDRTAINEQQLSGHGWYLRALCEYYEWKHDPATLRQVRTIIRNLALPLRGEYAKYPIDPALRTHAAQASSPGAVDGHLNAQHGNWALSSDTGCAFIFLDGLAHAWVVLRAANAPEAAPLKALIDEAIDRFMQIDLIAIKAQVHASLTATRALLRVYAATGEPERLASAQQRYRLYRATAMTENYANFNWFGRPDSWTEPCAVIDSFMVATQLWQHTGNPAYLEDAHQIWFNGIGSGMRANGGFGTDTCAGSHTPFLRVRSYEAYFCCTMRGGEGHARAAQYLYFTRPGEITVPFFSPSEATLPLRRGSLRLRQTTAYPYSGKVRFEVLATSAPSAVTLRLFAARWTSGHRLTLNGKPVRASIADGFLTAAYQPAVGDVLELDQTLTTGARDPLSSAVPAGAYVFEAGPLVLGYKSPATPADSLRAPDPATIRIRRDAALEPTPTRGEYRVQGSEIALSRINDGNDILLAQNNPYPRQILFR